MNEYGVPRKLSTMEKLINTAERDGYLKGMEISATYVMDAAKEIAAKWDALDPEEKKVFRTPYYKLFLKKIHKINEDKIPGGLADNKTVKDIADKHDTTVDAIEKEIEKGSKVEKEHTDDKDKAKEIAKDHAVEDDKYYEGLANMEKSIKERVIKKLHEEMDLTVTDESPDTITVLAKFNDRNAGMIMLTPAKSENTYEIVGIRFKEDYKTLFIINQAIKSLWPQFPEVNTLIVAPKKEGIEFWNKLGFSRISKNYLSLNRGH